MARTYGFADFSEFPQWTTLRRLQNEMNRLFEDGGQGGSYPPVNVWSNQDVAVAAFELPGMDPKAIEVTVNGNYLTLSGKRSAGALEQGATLHRQERQRGEFTRTIELPFPVQAGTTEAEYRNGVLSVTLPRAEEHKPRKIQVN